MDSISLAIETIVIRLYRAKKYFAIFDFDHGVAAKKNLELRFYRRQEVKRQGTYSTRSILVLKDFRITALICCFTQGS